MTLGREWTPTKSSRIPLEIPLPVAAPEPEKPSIFESLATTAETMWLYVRLVPYFTQVLKGLVMHDWKTTITGILGAIAYAVNYFTGVVIPPDVIVLATTVIGLYLAPDRSKQPK